MSYILDALRKAEAQRRRQEQAPGIEPSSTPPWPRRRRRPSVIFWLSALAIVSLNVMALGFFWMKRDVAAVDIAVDTAILSQQEQPTLTLPGQSRVSSPPLLSELPSSMRAKLGAMKVNAHVHAGENSARSYVIIDGERLRNGSKSAAGFKVLKIERRQLILEYRRRKFRIVTVEELP